MKAPKKGDPAQQFTLRNSSGKDIRFTGWKLAEVDNYNPLGKDPQTGFATGSVRWKERAVYQTESGKIVCHKLGCSKMPGEVDRGEVIIIASGVTVAIETGTGRPASAMFIPAPKPPEQEIVEFFGGDPLAKELFAELGIEDVETID